MTDPLDIPDYLVLSPEERAASWERIALTSMKFLPDSTVRSTDPGAEQFARQLEEDRRLKSLARIRKMKSRKTIKSIDYSKMRWDPRKNKFVEDSSYSAPVRLTARPMSYLVTQSSRQSGKTETAIGAIDWSRVTKDNVEAVARLNGVWNDKYAGLTNGLRVMNVVNRLKGLIKRGGIVTWPAT